LRSRWIISPVRRISCTAAEEPGLEMMRRLKVLFDPDNWLNPGKMLPTGRGVWR
jgi:hypothetical protein